MSTTDRLFGVSGSALIFFSIFAGVAFVIRLVYGAVKQETAPSLIGALVETALMTFAGGFIAHTFIGLLLLAGHDSGHVGLLLSIGFFPIFGIPATVVEAFAHTGALWAGPGLLWIVAVVGCFIGMMDGFYSIRPPVYGHLVFFPLDVTWGLSGASLAVLLHLFGITTHAEDGRKDMHRYTGGFRLRGTHALTEGNVMSNGSSYPPGNPVYNHEYLHVWQNRIAGPFYILTHLLWYVVYGVIFGAAAAIVTQTNYGDVVQAYGYGNNPWEVMAYAVGGTRDTGKFIWGAVFLGIHWVLFFAGAIALFVGLFSILG